jgi:hypothetical protein
MLKKTGLDGEIPEITSAVAQTKRGLLINPTTKMVERIA